MVAAVAACGHAAAGVGHDRCLRLSISNETDPRVERPVKAAAGGRVCRLPGGVERGGTRRVALTGRGADQARRNRQPRESSAARRRKMQGQGIGVGGTGRRGCRLSRHSTIDQRDGSASTTRCWCLQSKSRTSPPDRSRETGSSGRPLRESRAVDVERAGAEVDDDGPGLRVRGVAMPGDAGIAVNAEAEVWCGIGVDAPPDPDEPRPETRGGEAGTPGLGGSERRFHLEPGAAASPGVVRDVGREMRTDVASAAHFHQVADLTTFSQDCPDSIPGRLSV